ncbi:hypothetical protein BZG36_03268 [Bifiguratus adelaidae]|uniref:NAD(P)-binding domain-containing protein n=1 Tax=Bifiguratus adelaidae TaxID=1938954 RepID=A0A261XXD1_9FUNG|nr:hypothetical protein BZG36_03268 [Bifiguratus adelaidae]
MTRNVAVFGATNSTGIEVISQLLAQTYQVTALVRSLSKLPNDVTSSSNLRLVEDDVQLAQDVDSTITESTDVMVVILSVTTEDGRVCSKGQHMVQDIAQGKAVQRLIIVSCDAVDNANTPTQSNDTDIELSAIADIARQEEMVKEGTIPWTILRPGGLTDESHTGQYCLVVSPTPGTISRADLADGIIRLIESNEHLYQVVRIIY